MDKFVTEGTDKVPYDQIAVIPFAVGKEVIRSHLRQEHLNRWKACKGCCQSKMLMSEPLPSKAKELQAMSRPKLKMAVRLLTGHTTVRTHVKLGLTKWQDWNE
jgi:hypothetical protein